MIDPDIDQTRGTHMPGNAPAVTDETELLLAYLDQQRDGIRNAAFGLTDGQIRLHPTTSVLTVGGLLKHVAATERYWINLALPPEPAPDQGTDGSQEGRASAYADTFSLALDDTRSGLLARYAEVARHTAEAVCDHGDLDSPVAAPATAPWFPAGTTWTLRWVLLHVIEETARHAGHADIVRESIDGAKMYELMAAAEGWPATDWLKPWQAPE
jgi:uncharacterized damage-inducible protein DinB